MKSEIRTLAHDFIFVPCRGIFFSIKDKLLGANAIQVSVPCRGILFFNYWCKIKLKRIYKFPSPVGESYFSIMKESYNYMTCDEVSVPCRGILFFNGNKRYKKVNKWFPSPVGESYFSMFTRLSSSKSLNGFPSPVGESYFSIWLNERWFILNMVSVPCRGILFFNLMK